LIFHFSCVIFLYISSCCLFLLLYEALQTNNDNVKFIIMDCEKIHKFKKFMTIFNHKRNVIVHAKCLWFFNHLHSPHMYWIFHIHFGMFNFIIMSLEINYIRHTHFFLILKIDIIIIMDKYGWFHSHHSQNVKPCFCNSGNNGARLQQINWKLLGSFTYMIWILAQWMTLNILVT